MYFLKVKNIFVFFLFFFFALLVFLFANAHAQTVLKGAVRAVVEKGEIIEVNFRTPINIYFSQIGDNISVFTLHEIKIGDNIYIPKGSRINGIITKIKNPERFGQDGAFEIDFNEIITPDNNKISIYANVSTNPEPIEKKVAKILTYDSALVAYGTFHGTVAGIQYGGIPLAIASHGISVLAGAGVGAGAGIIGSIVRKGKIPSVLTQIKTKLALKSDLYILGELVEVREIKPAKEKEYKGFRFNPRIKKEEIEIVINNVVKNHDDKYGNFIAVDFILKNNSPEVISLSNLVLLSEEDLVPLYPDLFLSSTESLKQVKSFDEINASLKYLVTSKKGNYYLAILDPLDGEEILRIPLSKK